MSDKALFIKQFTASTVSTAIPEPQPNIESLYRTVLVMKELLETLTRQRGNSLYSAVTVEDLYKTGFADLL